MSEDLHLFGGHLPLTDLGNSERFVAAHGADLKYVPAWGWLRWDGARWRPGDAWVYERAKTVVRSMYREAADEPVAKVRAALASHARASEGRGRILAMVALSATVPGIAAQVEDFDAHPFLLNVRNGTLDLRVGELRVNTREDLITKLAAVHYDPHARFEAWERFMAEATAGHDGLAAFLQRLAGYSLTGDTSEEIFPIAHGPGGRGKSTFLEALRNALGDYAGSVRVEALTDSGRSSGGHNEDIARLVGLRMVTAIEASEGDRLREGLIKSLTGGDTVSASRKNKPAFDYLPAFKLWMATNFVPRVRPEDTGMQRRIVKLPFENAPAKVDRGLKRKFRKPEARAAVLAWAVQGCVAWQRDGLNPPDCVTLATRQLWEEMDLLGQFFEECLVFGDDKRAWSKQIRAAYSTWCDDRDIAPRYRVSDVRLTNALKTRGCTRALSGGHPAWWGVGILDRLPVEGVEGLSEEKSDTHTSQQVEELSTPQPPSTAGDDGGPVEGGAAVEGSPTSSRSGRKRPNFPQPSTPSTSNGRVQLRLDGDEWHVIGSDGTPALNDQGQDPGEFSTEESARAWAKAHGLEVEP